MNVTQKLYKIDSNGNSRVWWMEYDAEKYRTHSGIDGGKIVVSGWQYPEAKNVGRANATTVKEQVELEVISQLTKKSAQGKYHASKSTADKGAKFIECMLAGKYDPKKHTKFPYWSQPKFDGVRCLVSKDGMQSRNGKPIVSCPHIMEALDPFFKRFPDVVLDGELYNHELRNDFEQIISLVRKTKPTTKDYIEASKYVQYHVYDVVDPSMTFSERNTMLHSVYGIWSKTIQPVATIKVKDAEHVQVMLNDYLMMGYEGQMLRDPDSYYQGKRSKGLLKHKEFEDAEFPIVAVTEGIGNWAGYAKSLDIRLEDGSVQSSGIRGSQTMLADVLTNAKEYTYATVRYQNRTADGKLRFPVAVALWKGQRDL